MNGDLPDLLAQRAALSPAAVALEEVSTGRVLTYADLNRRASAAAALMAARGVAAGDRVAILCRNRPEFFEILFGCAKLGAILVPLNWRMPPAELQALVEDAEPALLLYGENDRKAAVAIGLPCLGLDTDYPRLIETAGPVPMRQTWPAQDMWYLLYTSGTTGRSKGVIYTYAMNMVNFVNIGTALGIGAGDRTACFLPLFHTAGINLHALPTLFAGGRVLVLDGFDADTLVSLLQARRLDTMFAVPTVYRMLLDHPELASTPLQAVRHWGCGGAPLPERLVDQYRSLGVRLCNGMGMTETGPTAFLLDPAHAWEKAGSVGKPQLLCRTRIIGADGSDVRPGEVGELLFSGPGVTPGYWRNPESTRAAYTPDGWLRSGDLARVDADGFTYVIGRQKEMFISGGENVFPVEVENVLSGHPAVVDAAVLPAPDDRWGEVGRAYIQVAPGRRADSAELQAFCRARLAPYKVPSSFTVVPDFPRTSAGKIQKHLLG